jgi:hypothetical protein
MTRTAWADAETTGLDPRNGRHHAWEIALIVRDEDNGEPDREYAWQLRHDLSEADPLALGVGRYYERCVVADWEIGTGKAIAHPDEGLTEKVLFHHGIAAEIASLIPGAVFTAANPAFDSAFIGEFLRVHGHCASWDYHLRDTGTLIRGYLHGLAAAGNIAPSAVPSSLRLDDLVRAVGIEPRDYDRHSALGDVRMIRDAEDVITRRATVISRNGKPAGPVTITNYDRLHHFSQDDFGGVVADESSCIKSFDGVRRSLVTDFLRKMPYRLLATATAAPNDFTELGTSSEALGYLGHMDMLGRFFTNKKQTSKAMGGKWRSAPGEEWRLKGHAEEPFWRWVASWARALRKPSDLGFDDTGFVLPPLEYRTHLVQASSPREGTLFDVPAAGLHEERDEMRRTVTERCEKAAEALADARPGVAWCFLNAEGDLLTRLIDGAVQVTGSDDPDAKEEQLAAFTRGEIRVLVTKPKIGAWGLNWQHCHRMTYFADYSFEAHYQAVRRCLRFGQQHPVTVDMITTPGSANALKSLQRKSAQADAMFAALTAHMRDALGVRRSEIYDRDVEVPSWARS